MSRGAAVRGTGFTGSSSNSWFQIKNNNNRNNFGRNRVKVICGASSSSVMDAYKILRIKPGASQSQVRDAYRQLALQYHPDVCKGNNCGVQFSKINEAYDIVMSKLGRELEKRSDQGIDKPYDEDWDMWQEWWMGWEGGEVFDYPYDVNE